jgi:alpha-L-fucosidase
VHRISKKERSMKTRSAIRFLAIVAATILLTTSRAAWAADEPASPGAIQNETKEQRDRRLAWWRQARFGLFIHWGPVSLKGTEIGWSRGREVPVAEYDQLYKQFNPEKFNAKQWVDLAKAAGMKYIVITSKHHAGFSIFDSKAADYDITATPFRRDVVKELADECKRQGLRFCTYYSIIDWYHPDYLPRGAGDKRSTETANFDRYVAFMKEQLRELVTQYGPLGILWFDGEWENHWTPERGWDLYGYVRGLQPDIIVNNRVGKGRKGMAGTNAPGSFAGDYLTPEQQLGTFNTETPWETCMTLGTQWAWKPNDTIKPIKQCIDSLVMCATGDGNLLLNVGPTASGEIETPQAERLREMGAWLAKYGESIYGTRGGPIRNGKWGGATCKGNVVYLHILNWTADPLKLPALPSKIVQSKSLTGGDPKLEQSTEGLTVSLPRESRDSLDTIIRLELESPVPAP